MSVFKGSMLKGLAACLIFTLTAPGHALAEKEATLYYVDNHSGAGACGGGNFTWADDTAEYLRDSFNLWNFAQVSLYSNAWLDFRDIADQDEDPAGRDAVDPAGIDSADVGFIYSHGFRSACDGVDHDFSGIQMGDNNTTCGVRYGRYNNGNDAWFGDEDLNILIVDTCHSVDRCVWDDFAYTNTSDNMGALLGFHGISYDSSKHTDHMEDFVDSSRYNGLGDNWVSMLTDLRPGSNNDECATAVVYGATRADINFIFDRGGLDDWKTVTGDRSVFWYIKGCNPAGSRTL